MNETSLKAGIGKHKLVSLGSVGPVCVYCKGDWPCSYVRQKDMEADNGDPVEHPRHYGGDTAYEAIKVIEAWGLGFCDGNALKYLSRWRQKGGLTDLKKARWYLDRMIQQLEAKSDEGR